MISWEMELETAVGRSREADPPLKDFSPKNSEIPILEDYSKEDLGEDYWGKWPSNPYKEEMGSRMDRIAMQSIADEIGYKRKDKVKDIVNNLKNGAKGFKVHEGQGPVEPGGEAPIQDHGVME